MELKHSREFWGVTIFCMLVNLFWAFATKDENLFVDFILYCKVAVPVAMLYAAYVHFRHKLI